MKCKYEFVCVCVCVCVCVLWYNGRYGFLIACRIWMNCLTFVCWNFIQPTILTIICNLHFYGKFCSRYHYLLNFRTDLFKVGIFKKFMIRHWCQCSFLNSHTQKNCFSPKNLRLGIDSAASSGGQGKQTLYFVSHQLEARLSISMFCLLFTRAVKILFLIYSFFISSWSPKDVT